jgi:hypothetical protein
VGHAADQKEAYRLLVELADAWMGNCEGIALEGGRTP